MMGWSARTLCAVILFAAIIGSLAQKSKKNKKAPPPGAFGPPLPLPPIAPFRLASVTPKPTSLDPYACLPKYLCIVQNKNGEKRTTIVHGLHPALRKSKPNVIDPETLPQFPSNNKPAFPPPLITTSDSSDDELLFRDREFNDGFLKQQEMAETMAFLEEKRRQFLYQQGLPKSKIFGKGVTKPEAEDDKSKESVEEEEEKSKEEEVSKEEKSKEEVSKEEKEDGQDKSVEVSKEEKEKPDKSVEVSKEEKEGVQEEESAEDDSSSESKSRSKLSKYKIKKKAYSKNPSMFQSRMDEDYDESGDRLATVPWDDRVKKNDSDPLNPSEIYDKLVGNLKILPKIARRLPGMSYLTGADDEPTTTTTKRPGLLRRMLMAATGTGSKPSNSDGRPMRRYKRDTESDEEEEEDDDEIKVISDDAKIVKEIRDPARQCRMISPGCDLPYEHIMKMVSSGQVLIENDRKPSTTRRPPVADPATQQDDEMEQALKDKAAQKKSKPIPQLLAQASLGGNKKVKGPGSLPIFGKNKHKPSQSFEEGSDEQIFDEQEVKKPKKGVASLPLMPMRYQWGKPVYTVHGKPTYSKEADFSGGIRDPNIYKTTPPPTTTTTTTPRPIFAPVPLDVKDNSTGQIQHSVIQVNKTHAVHVLSKKPYNPQKIRTRDAKGNPLSFNAVFTEIAGNTGGIHDFFERISGAFGGEGKESGRELAFSGNGKIPDSPHAKPTAFPSAPIPPDHIIKEDDDAENGSAQRDDEEDGSEEDAEDEEENGDAEDNEEDEEDPADDVEVEEKAPEVQQEKPKVKPKPVAQSEPEKTKSKPDKKKKPIVEEEEEEEEEAGDDGEDEIHNLPDNIPPFIRQSMIEDLKRKKQEKEQGGGGGRPGQGQAQGQHHQPGGHGRPGGQGHGRPGAQYHGGRPGQHGHGGPGQHGHGGPGQYGHGQGGHSQYGQGHGGHGQYGQGHDHGQHGGGSRPGQSSQGGGFFSSLFSG